MVNDSESWDQYPEISCQDAELSLLTKLILASHFRQCLYESL